MHKYTNMYIFTHTCVSINTSICISIYMCMHTYIYIYTSTYTCICIYIYVYMCFCIHAKDMCFYTNVCIDIHTFSYGSWRRCGIGWRRLIGSPKLQIIFHKRATKCRSRFRKMTYKDKGSCESLPPCTIIIACLVSLNCVDASIDESCLISLRHV